MNGAPTHRTLQRELAAWLREAGWLTFTEIDIPPAGGRVDVVAVKPHAYMTKDLRAYEVKATRSDLLGDLNSEKWRNYHAVFPRVIFALPAGIAKKEDFPREVGIAIRGEHGWSHLRSGLPHKPPRLTVDAILALLYRGYEETLEERDLKRRLAFDGDGTLDFRATAVRVGHDIAHRLASKTPPLGDELADLRAAIEEALNIKLRSPADVLAQAHRIRRLGYVLQEWERHGGTLLKISHYLSALQSPWGDLGELVRYTEEKLEEARGQKES